MGGGIRGWLGGGSEVSYLPSWNTVPLAGCLGMSTKMKFTGLRHQRGCSHISGWLCCSELRSKVGFFVFHF